jgi:hypothetical protein
MMFQADVPGPTELVTEKLLTEQHASNSCPENRMNQFGLVPPFCRTELYYIHLPETSGFSPPNVRPCLTCDGGAGA